MARGLSSGLLHRHVGDRLVLARALRAELQRARQERRRPRLVAGWRRWEAYIVGRGASCVALRAELSAWILAFVLLWTLLPMAVQALVLAALTLLAIGIWPEQVAGWIRILFVRAPDQESAAWNQSSGKAGAPRVSAPQSEDAARRAGREPAPSTQHREEERARADRLKGEFQARRRERRDQIEELSRPTNRGQPEPNRSPAQQPSFETAWAGKYREGTTTERRRGYKSRIEAANHTPLSYATCDYLVRRFLPDVLGLEPEHAVEHVHSQTTRWASGRTPYLPSAGDLIAMSKRLADLQRITHPESAVQAVVTVRTVAALTNPVFFVSPAVGGVAAALLEKDLHTGVNLTSKAFDSVTNGRRDAVHGRHLGELLRLMQGYGL